MGTDKIPTLAGCVTLNKCHNFSEFHFPHLIIVKRKKDNECKTLNMVLPYRMYSKTVSYYVHVNAGGGSGVFSRLNT